MVIDVLEANTRDGQQLILYEWHGGDNQRFDLNSEGIKIPVPVDWLWACLHRRFW